MQTPESESVVTEQDTVTEPLLSVQDLQTYFFTDEGRMANSSFLDYRIPTALDLPMIDTVIVEVPNPGHPFGVRGVGEASIAPPPAAISCAIKNAVGVQLCVLPMRPDRILAALDDARAQEPVAAG